MKKYIAVAAILIILFLCYSLYIVIFDRSDSKEASTIQQTSFGLYPDQEFKTDRFATIRISGNMFSGTIQLHNVSDTIREYELFAVIDYEQFLFSLNGSKGEHHRVKVEPGRNVQLSFQMDSLPDGAHDLILFYIADPDKMNTEDEFVPPPEFFGWTRASLYVNNSYYPEFKPTLELTGDPNKSFKVSGIVLSKFEDEPSNSEGLPLYVFEEVKDRDNMNFYVHLGAKKEGFNFVLIPFMGSKQAKIKVQGKEYNHIKGFIEVNRQAVLKAEISPEVTGSANFFMIQIRNPQVRLEDFAKKPFDVSIRSTPKLSIIKNHL